MTRFISALLVFLLAPTLANAIVSGKETRDRDGLRRTVVRIESSIGELCSGVLVAPDVVLTATHCLLMPARYQVFALDRSFRPLVRNVVATKTHGDFVVGQNPKQQSGVDLALLKLDGSLTDDFQPIAIETRIPVRPEQELFLAGYGSISYKNEKSARTLRTAKLLALAVNQPPNNLIIAGDPKRRSDTTGAGACRGDSGGPALVLTKQGYALAGIASWSARARRSKENYPCGGITAITPLAPHARWLATNIGAMSNH